VEHPTYKSIFGERVFDVAPADMPGMEYMTWSTMFGYQILFSWNEGGLIVRARKPENSQILQLIPRINLIDDFPQHFVYEYIHWLDLKTGELEFRPTAFPWTPRPSNWRLRVYFAKYRLQKKKMSLGIFCAMPQNPCQDI